MNVEHVYRIASDGWWHCHGHKVEQVSEWPRLAHNALVVLDLDEVFTDVWRFEGKSEYAAALIEKRVRAEGLVDGAAHIVLHRLVKLPQGFQAFFSAVSLAVWQRCLQWAKEQSTHCLVQTSAGLLCHNVGNNKARLMLSQHRLTCFAQTEVGMVFSASQALSSNPSTMSNAAKMLATNQRSLLLSLAPKAVEWSTLWSIQNTDTCLEAVRSVLGDVLSVMPAQELDFAGQRVHTVLPKLAVEAAYRQSLNPFVELLAWRTERWVVPIAVVTALTGAVFAIIGVLMGHQAEQQQIASLNARSELVVLQGRIQAVSSIENPAQLLPIADFSRAMDAGARHDPVAFLALLKEASGRDVRIQRVRLATQGQKRAQAFLVDGTGTSTSIARWVSHMAASGWALKALDPAYVLPGAFSYELVAMQPVAGSAKQ